MFPAKVAPLSIFSLQLSSAELTMRGLDESQEVAWTEVPSLTLPAAWTSEHSEAVQQQFCQTRAKTK